ncbi:MAG: hypothetical protein QW251_05855 [Desulfurococcaceae archaeon]
MRKVAYEDIIENGEAKIDYEHFCKALAYLVSMPDDVFLRAKEKLKAKRLRKKPSKAERHVILYTYRRIGKLFPEVPIRRRKFFLAYILVYLLRITSCRAIENTRLGAKTNIRLPSQAIEVIDTSLLKLKALLGDKSFKDICPGHFKSEREALFDTLKNL